MRFMEKLYFIDKKVGETTSECILRLRLMYVEIGDQKVGHLGTLDPMASGLMIFMVGDGTKQFTEMQKMDKTYTFSIIFGVETDSWDVLGVVKQYQVLGIKYNEGAGGDLSARMNKELRIMNNEGQGDDLSTAVEMTKIAVEMTEAVGEMTEAVMTELAGGNGKDGVRMKDKPTKSHGPMTNDQEDDFSLRSKDIINHFKGKIMQCPPPYSAIRINGKPLYWWFRNNRQDEIEIKPREREIFSIEMTNFYDFDIELFKDDLEIIRQIDGDFRQKEIIEKWREIFKAFENAGIKKLPAADMMVRCSSGTYIRSLVHDIGEKLGVPCFAYNIRRVAIGDQKL